MSVLKSGAHRRRLVAALLVAGVVGPLAAVSPVAARARGVGQLMVSRGAGRAAHVVPQPTGGYTPTGRGYRVPTFDHVPAKGGGGSQLPHAMAVPAHQRPRPLSLAANAVEGPITVAGPHAQILVTLTDFSADQKAAFLAAAQTWANQLYDRTPITIDAGWDHFGAGTGILGGGGPDEFFQNQGDGLLYPAAMANMASGTVQNPGSFDIDILFNVDYANWSFAAGGPTQTTEDFQSVATHEIGHGVGFASTFTANGDPTGGDPPGGPAGSATCPVNAGCFGLWPSVPAPAVYDVFAEEGVSGGTALASLPNASQQLFSAEQSNNVFWGGEFGAANNPAQHAPPKLFFPQQWAPGSSGAHLDASYIGTTDGLMAPALPAGSTTRTLGTVTPGMLLDMGWTHQSPEEAFIRKLYPDFIGRDAAANDIAIGSAVLDQSHDPYGFALALANSNEWLTNIVKNLYSVTLNRPNPSQAEIDYWVSSIRNGTWTVASASANFYASDEYYGIAGGTDQKWVDQLYQVLLHRTADGGGEMFWVNRIQSLGLPGRGIVALEFFQSEESRLDRVAALYVKLLLRQPDAAGQAYWADRILNDGDIALAANLAASDEYLGIALNELLFLPSPS